MSGNNLAVGIVLVIPFLLVFGGMIYQGEVFDMNIGDHMQRAANANNIDLARDEMQIVVENMEKEGMTSGFTSVLYKTPSDDVGFWYENMKEAYQGLESVDSGNVTLLEESNVLMKLRESLTDSSDGDATLAVPDGISRFPHNKLWAIAFWGTGALALAGYVIMNKR